MLKTPETDVKVKGLKVTGFDVEVAIQNWNKDFALKILEKIERTCQEIRDLLDK